MSKLQGGRGRGFLDSGLVNTVVRLSPEGAYIHTQSESQWQRCQGHTNESGGMAHSREKQCNCPPSVMAWHTLTVVTWCQPPLGAQCTKLDKMPLRTADVSDVFSSPGVYHRVRDLLCINYWGGYQCASVLSLLSHTKKDTVSSPGPGVCKC